MTQLTPVPPMLVHPSGPDEYERDITARLIKMGMSPGEAVAKAKEAAIAYGMQRRFHLNRDRIGAQTGD